MKRICPRPRMTNLTAPNPRLNAFRDDLADIGLKGAVSAQRYLAGEPAWIAVPVADLKRSPSLSAGLDTQLLLGDLVSVFERANGWAWVQNEADFYVGYVEENALSETPPEATHRVCAPRSFVYSGSDLRLPVQVALSMGNAVRVTGEAETRGTRYLTLADGTSMIAAHLVPIDQHVHDYVAVAETLLNTPYLWGGASGLGIDCSGLVQLSLRMAGRSVSRDTSMQEANLGETLDPDADFTALKRGDLVFWNGHVAIMTSAADMIHANGHTMLVSREPLKDAVARIGYLYGQPTGFRRP